MTPAMMLDELLETGHNIYKTERALKKTENDIYLRLLSIHLDSKYLHNLIELQPFKNYPLVGNLRCGKWYYPKFHTFSYFKSTDGHCGHWKFNLRRSNLNLAFLAAKNLGALIVDSTRKGKTYPDSFSRTLPIWATVLNRVIYRLKTRNNGISNMDHVAWNSLLLPEWISDSEKSLVEVKLVEFCEKLLASETLIPLLENLSKELIYPFSCGWISPRSEFYNEGVNSRRTWLLLICPSIDQTIGRQKHKWYIQGAADDEESWSQGLTPGLFWKYRDELLNQDVETTIKVRNIVESHDPQKKNRNLGFSVDKNLIYKSSISPIIDSDDIKGIYNDNDFDIIGTNSNNNNNNNNNNNDTIDDNNNNNNNNIIDGSKNNNNTMHPCDIYYYQVDAISNNFNLVYKENNDEGIFNQVIECVKNWIYIGSKVGLISNQIIWKYFDCIIDVSNSPSYHEMKNQFTKENSDNMKGNPYKTLLIDKKLYAGKIYFYKEFPGGKGKRNRFKISFILPFLLKEFKQIKPFQKVLIYCDGDVCIALAFLVGILTQYFEKDGITLLKKEREHKEVDKELIKNFIVHVSQFSPEPLHSIYISDLNRHFLTSRDFYPSHLRSSIQNKCEFECGESLMTDKM